MKCQTCVRPPLCLQRLRGERMKAPEISHDVKVMASI
jgi:hypothetical protein